MPRAAVLLVSALTEEHRAVVHALSKADPDAEHRGDGTCVAVVERLTVAAVCLAATGNAGAAAGAQLAIDIWRPRHLILVGIAAGADTHALKLGDVLIADTLIGYEFGKYDEDGLQRRPDVYRSSFALLRSAKAVRAEDWVPPAFPDGPAASVDVHFGTLLSGEKVIADQRTFTELRRAWPTTIGVEMEGLGVATAAHRNGLGFLVVKGVSDFADAAKDAPTGRGPRTRRPGLRSRCCGTRPPRLTRTMTNFVFDVGVIR